MVGHGRRATLVVALVVVCVTVLAGVAYATITDPPTNPYAVPGDEAGNPLPFTITASGFNVGQNVFIEECDGKAATAPGWDPALDCDPGDTTPAKIADDTGTASFAVGTDWQFTAFKGESPSSQFNCLGPDDPAMTPINFLQDWTNCQIRISSNNASATGDQQFLAIVLPDSPGDPTTTTTSSTSTSTSTTSTSTSTTSSTTTTTVVIPPPASPGSVSARPGSTTLPTTGPIIVTYVAGANHGSPITKFTATCKSSNGGVTKTVVHLGAAVVPIGIGGATLKRTYTCTVTETTAHGTSPASLPSAAIVVGAPARVGTPGALRIAAGRLRVSFPDLTGAQMNGSPLSTPRYTATCTSTNGGVARGAIGVASPIVVAALTPGRTYTCYVRAHNARGYSLASVRSAARVA
jgi:hypothetical protein